MYVVEPKTLLQEFKEVEKVFCGKKYAKYAELWSEYCTLDLFSL